MGPFSCPSQNFLDVRVVNCKKKGIYFKKIAKNGFHFQPKWNLEIGRGFEAPAVDPLPNQMWVSPGLLHVNEIPSNSIFQCSF